MPFFAQFPYTDFHELNLDYVLRLIAEMKKTIDTFVSTNAIKYADPFQWNIITQYEKNTVVMDANSGVAYLSVQPVPAGIAISNTNYWTPVFDLSQLFTDFNKNLTANDEMLNITSSTNYAVGDWLIWKNKLYEVIAPITAGDLLITGINLKQITIESVVDAINTVLTATKNKLNNLKIVNVIDYGADPSGVNDSLQAITDAMNANNFCTLYFPHGSYKISDALPSLGHHNIKGEGQGVTFLLFDNVTGDCITINDWRCSIEDVMIKTSTSDYAVKCESTASNAVIKNCVIDCVNGVDMQGALDIIRDTYIKCPNGTGVNTASGDASQALYNVAVGSELADLSDTGIGIKINGGCSSLTIEGCDVILKRFAVYINADSNIFSLKINHNFFDNSVDDAILIDGSATVYRSEVKDNWLGANKYGIAAGNLVSVDGLEISGNDFLINSVACIHIKNAGTLIINDNKFANGAVAFDAFSTQSRVRFMNNVVGEYGGESGMTNALSYYGGVPTSMLVADNDFTGCTNVVFGSPGATVFRDNIAYP